MNGVPMTRRQIVLVALALGVATLVFVGQDYVTWLGSWGETSRTLDTSTLLTYPAVAGVAAWFTSASRRQRYQWMLDSAARPRHAIHLRMASLHAALASAGLLTAAALAVAATATQATFGSFPVVDLFTIVAGFFAASGLGVACATLVPSVLSPISALSIVYAAEAFGDTSRPSLRPLAGLIVADSRDHTYLSAATWMLGVRGLWLVAVALVFVAIAARAGSKAFLPFAATCLTAVPLLLVGDAGMSVNEAATQPVCHHPSASVTLCMSAGMDHMYPSVWSALHPELDLLDGLAQREWHLDEASVAHQMTASSIDGAITVPFETPNGVFGDAHVVDRHQLQAEFSDRLMQDNCGPGGSYTGETPFAGTEDVIQAWVLRELGIATDGSEFEFSQFDLDSLDYAGVEVFRTRWDSMTANERRAWFRAHGQDVVQCQLRNVDVMTP